MPIRTKVSLAAALGVALATATAVAAPSGNAPAPISSEVEQVETLGTGSLSGYYLAARQASVNQDINAAAGFFVAALEKDRGNTELLDSSVILNVASGNIGEAVTLAEELLRSDPEDWIALTTLAVGQIRDGERDAAVETLGRLQSVGGQIQDLIAGLLESWTLVADGRAAQAINTLDELNGPSWYDPFTTLHAGLIADPAGLEQIAEDRLRLAYERDPGSPRLVEAYARFLARSGRAERAGTVLDAFEERLGGSDQYTSAVREDIKSQPVAPLIGSPLVGAAEALYGLGTAYARDGGNAQAAGLFQLALFLSPQSDYAAMALGEVMGAMRQYETAIEIYRRIPADHPLSRNAMVQQAVDLNSLERYDEAIALLSEAVDADPTDVATTVVLGNVYRSQERFAEARDVYSQAIGAFDEVPEPYWMLHYYRGIARERTDDWPGAEADFRKALTFDETNAHTLNYLGYSLVDRGEKLDEAIDMVRRAVAAEPGNGYIVDSLGWAYYRLGRYEDAVRELERAVSLKPIDPVINDHLGDAYWRVGRRLEATFQWAHARDNDPSEEIAPAIREKLANGLTEGPQTVQAAADTPPSPAPSAPAPSAPAPSEAAPSAVPETNGGAPSSSGDAPSGSGRGAQQGPTQ